MGSVVCSELTVELKEERERENKRMRVIKKRERERERGGRAKEGDCKAFTKRQWWIKEE